MDYTNLYVQTDKSLDEVVRLAGAATGIRFEEARTEDGERYFCGTYDSDRGQRVFVQDNEDDDETLDLPRYTFEFDIEGRDDESRKAYARELLEKLKPLGMPMKAIDNYGEIVGVFEP